MTYEIRQVSPTEAKECVWLGDITNPPDLERYNEVLNGNRILLVCKENGEYRGQVALVFDKGDCDYTVPNRRVYLSRLIVTKEHRNRGIGGKLIDYLVDYASGLGYQEISVGVDLDNVGARHLYEKKGFTEVIFEGKDELGKYVKLLKTL